MNSWPPSPVVEDEATALAKEYGTNTTHISTAGDHTVPSRGSVDQYPIICDTSCQNNTVTPATDATSKTTASPDGAKEAEQDSRSEHGLYTPPSSDTESRGRSSHSVVSGGETVAGHPTRSQSTSGLGEVRDHKHRPSISRISTDVAGELLRMKAGTRRDPSPYSYKRESATTQTDSTPKSAIEQFLSPARAMESPISARPSQPVHNTHKEARCYDSSTDSERKPKKVLRFADKPMGPAPPSRPRKSFSLPQSQMREQEMSDVRLQLHSDIDATKQRRHRHHRRHHSADPVSDASTDRESRSHRSKTHQSRSPSQARESTRLPPPQQPTKSESSRCVRPSTSDGQPARRHLSHRHERPQFDEPVDLIPLHSRTNSEDDDQSRRVYRIREGRDPMTPPCVTPSTYVEDYFSKAFEENALRHSRRRPHSSADDTAVFSPPTSPPRTPRSERRGRSEYFESPSSSPHRTPRGSRPPSLEESQLRDLKAHHSLLSQATAGAAAVAAKISPPATRSSSTIETSLENVNPVIVTKSRSRVSSPAREPARQLSYSDTPNKYQTRSRPTSPQRESLRPIIHRADSVDYPPPRSRASSPRREFARSTVRSDTYDAPQPRSGASSPQREQLRPVIHHVDSLAYPKPRSRASSPQRELTRPVIRADSLSYEKPRSRASSPQREVSKPAVRTESLTNVPNVTRTFYVPTAQAQRPSTRDGLPQSNSLMQPPRIQPQRTASFTGHEHQRPYLAYTPGPLHAVTAISNEPISTSLNVPPPLPRSYSASTPYEISQKMSDFILPTCPRSQPTQGLRDWMTFRGGSNVDICPKCVHALGATCYRSLLVRSPDKPYNRNTVCALSRPWVRIAVIECVKRNKMDLSSVSQVNTLLLGAWPCAGASSDIRMWWRVPDSSTGRTVPGFLACSACVELTHVVYPELRNALIQDDLNHHGVCGLRSGTREFSIYMEQIGKIAAICREQGTCRTTYLQPLVDAIKRNNISHNQNICARDRMITHRPWHYMKALPEFTICESCFEEVVWPIKDRPYAREICRTLQIVPPSAYKGFNREAANSGGMHPISCQLYSDRMRRLFGDLVSGRLSWESFRHKARERQAVQYEIIDVNTRYEADMKAGWDRRKEVARNWDRWKRLE